MLLSSVEFRSTVSFVGRRLAGCVDVHFSLRFSINCLSTILARLASSSTSETEQPIDRTFRIVQPRTHKNYENQSVVRNRSPTDKEKKRKQEDLSIIPFFAPLLSFLLNHRTIKEINREYQ